MWYSATESCKEVEKKVVSLILEKNMPLDRIFLLGSTVQQDHTESVFITIHTPLSRVSHYYLLALISEKSGQSINEIQDRIENACAAFMPVTALVLSSTQFTSWVHRGHLFAQVLLEKGTLLYQAPNIASEEILPNTNEVPGDGGAKFTIKVVSEFIAGAELYQLRNNYTMAAFMLHQGAEHALNGIFKHTAGIHITTHNIEKLIRFCSMVTSEITVLFPPHNPNTRQMIHLLQSAYVNGRYTKQFAIKETELLWMGKKVSQLQELLMKCVQS